MPSSFPPLLHSSSSSSSRQPPPASRRSSLIAAPSVASAAHQAVLSSLQPALSVLKSSSTAPSASSSSLPSSSSFSSTVGGSTTTITAAAVSRSPSLSRPPDKARNSVVRISRRLPILSRSVAGARVYELAENAIPARVQSLRATLPPAPPAAASQQSTGAELVPRQQSAQSGPSVTADLPPTQSTPDPASLSHALPAPPARPSAPLRKPGDAKLNTLDDKRRKLGRRQSTNLGSATPRSTRGNPLGEGDRKMHQTSSRLLRMTDDDRPFTRDFKDLFSTLMVSLPLCPHRVRFQKIDHTFTSEEAITNLGSLKFSQSNRMPDPKDPSRIVTTTTTTTFSMAKEMARSVCQKFLEARFVESVDGRTDFSSKSSVWQMTPKGMHILQRFCQRNGINQRHVQDVLESSRNTMQLVILEREADTDKLNHDQATVEVIFRRFAGHDGPNAKANIQSSDSDSLNEYATGMVGVKMARERKIADKTFWNTFTGKAAVDWLMDCCTMVDKRETYEICNMFIEHGLIQPVDHFSSTPRFQPTKSSIYFVTEKGQRVAGWISSPKGSINGDANANRPRDGASRDSNANRMTVIIRDPALRLLFREFLRDTHCEENLAFYLDVKEFLASYASAKRSAASPKLEVIRETLAAAYSLYNAFLAPGSPCELNIDHTLRTALAGRMTRAVGDDDAMIKSLDEVASLFDQAQNSVFKLMASDSVPKFMREPKYSSILRERNLEASLGTFGGTRPT